MRQNRKRSRWPSVSALVCLLLLCLAIPLYWQAGDMQVKKPEVAPKRAKVTSSSRRASNDWPTDDEIASFERSSGHATKHDSPTQPIASGITDHFLFGYSGPQPTVSYSAQSEPGDVDLFTELLTSPGTNAPANVHVRSTEEPAVPGPYVTAILHRAGYDLSRLTTEQLTALAERLGRFEPSQSGANHVNDSSSVRLGSPSGANSYVDSNEPTPVIATDQFSTPWATPSVLLDRLEVLADLPYSADWARQTLQELRQLTENDRFVATDACARLNHLTALAAKAVELANASDDDHLRAELLRAHWALERRVQCWTLMREIVVASAQTNRFAARIPIDSTSNVMSGQGTATSDNTPTELTSLSDQLESYERTRSPRIARAIIERQRLLSQSPDTKEQALADQIEENYRNANIRVAVTAALLSRYVPQSEPETQPVHDRIVGTPVHGVSHTVAENRVNLLPDDSRWNMGLTANGTVSSDTVANGGSAMLRTLGTTQFSAEKAIVVDKDGNVQVGPSTVTADNQSQLVGVRTQFDQVPLVGDVVRQQAIEQYYQKRPQAKSETEFKVASRIQDQMNDRTGAAVDRLKQQLHDRLTGPLQDAGLTLTPVELATTNERVVARLRLAGDDQLAAHTPRPRAPGDSLASLQIHESAFTNATLSLGLDGKTYTAQQLQQQLRERIPRLRDHAAMEIKDDTVFKFAAQDAVRVRVADNHLEVILDLDEVTLNKETAREFRVHAYYKPEINGLEATLVRDGALGIEGKLRTSDRSRMHGVFNKIMAEDQHIPIVRLTDPQDARLGGLMITQLVLEDGWLGMAVGPEAAGRTAELSRMLR